jgi:hypothetical protein
LIGGFELRRVISLCAGSSSFVRLPLRDRDGCDGGVMMRYELADARANPVLSNAQR